MSARVADPPSSTVAHGTPAGAIGEELGPGFGYGPMEHALMIVRLSDKEIVE